MSSIVKGGYDGFSRSGRGDDEVSPSVVEGSFGLEFFEDFFLEGVGFYLEEVFAVFATHFFGFEGFA